MTLRKTLRVGLLTSVIGAMLLTSCAQSSTGSTVRATLTEMAIALDQASVPAGVVTFNVKNSGTVVHELVVLKTDLAQDKIPVDSADATKVKEDGSLGETGDLAAGAAKVLTLTLAAGNYVLICNQPSHYVGGMHIAFTVR